MTETTRKAKNCPFYQGIAEEVAYDVNTSDWGGYSTGVDAILKNPDGENVSETNMPGEANESDGVITTPIVKGLTSGLMYRLEILWVYGANKFNVFCHIVAEP